MKTKYLAAVLCLLLSVLAWGHIPNRVFALMQQSAANPSATPAQGAKPEETLIRNAYAKMSYADEVRIMVDAVSRTGRDRLWGTKADLVDSALSERLNVQLGDFQFGKISDIADRQISDFDGSPSAIGGEVLQITPSIFNYSVGKTASKYNAYEQFAWKPSPYQTLAPAENWPVAKALQDEQFDGKTYTDYVTYTVTVSFAGKSRTYNAWMLFGPDQRGREQVYFMDSVIDSTGVLFAAEHSFYPGAFAETDLGTVPFVNKWLYNNAQSCAAPHNDKDSRDDVCCDEQSGRCGVSRSLLSSHGFRRVLPGRWRHAQPRPASFHISSPDLHPFFQSAGCSQFNSSQPLDDFKSNNSQHNPGGQHSLTSSGQGICTYSDPTVGSHCKVSCQITLNGTASESGTINVTAHHHEVFGTQLGGQSNDNGSGNPVTCGAATAVAVESCLFTCSATFTISQVAPNGTATIVFPPNAIWTATTPFSQTCQAATAPQSCAAVPLGGPDGRAVACPGGPNGPTSPIVIDTEGEGFHLTSLDAGVTFDISGAGQPVQIAWTDPHYHNAFLALPASDGLVHNGKELFGNFTAQPPSDHPNGFIALAQYDKPENGGNADGIIDDHDEVFSRLRLWIDENHDGVCQPNELHRLPELGIYSLALNYTESRQTDQFGNQFRYKARVNPGERRDPRDETPSGDPGRWTYDVFFVAK